jgi:Fe-S cluster biogenesis protein NfuA
MWPKNRKRYQNNSQLEQKQQITDEQQEPQSETDGGEVRCF